MANWSTRIPGSASGFAASGSGNVGAISHLLAIKAKSGVALRRSATWGLFFEHGGRPEPESLGGLTIHGFRCVVANLHGFTSVLAKNSHQERHRTLLADFLVNDLDSKRWAGHPDLDGARAEAKDARMAMRRERPTPRAWELAMIERRRRDYSSLRARYGFEEPEEDPVAPASNLPIFERAKCSHRAPSRAITPRCPRCGLRMTQVEEAP